MVARSSLFILLYGCGTVLLNLSTDIAPVWNTLQKKIFLKRT